MENTCSTAGATTLNLPTVLSYRTPERDALVIPSCWTAFLFDGVVYERNQDGVWDAAKFGAENKSVSRVKRA